MQAAGNPVVLLDPVVAPRIAVARLVAGLLQGLLLYWLYSAAQDKAWPATQPYLLAPLMLIGLLLPVLLVSSLGHLSPRRIALWMAGAALVLTALALHDVSRGAEHFIWGNYKPGAPPSSMLTALNWSRSNDKVHGVAKAPVISTS